MHDIMIVDDEAIEASVIGQILMDRGFDVCIQNRPRSAMDLAQKHSFDLIISDLKMPEMDGLELLQSLSRIDPDVTVIIMRQLPLSTFIDVTEKFASLFA